MYFQSPTMHVQTQICCIQDQYYAFDKTTELDYSFFQLENIWHSFSFKWKDRNENIKEKLGKILNK